MSDKINELLQEGPRVINVGVQDFATNLKSQGVEVVQLHWAPPAGGDKELMDILDQLL